MMSQSAGFNLRRRWKIGLVIYFVGFLTCELLLLWSAYNGAGFERPHTISDLAVLGTSYLVAGLLWPVLLVMVSWQRSCSIRYGSNVASVFKSHCSRQRRADQRAIEALFHVNRPIKPEPREAVRVSGAGCPRQSFPQHSRQLQRRALHGLQQLQRRDQPLFDVGKIAAERK